MTLPVVKPELIRTLGEQMRDRTYLAEVEQAMYEENKHLFKVCINNLSVIDMMANKIVGEMDDVGLDTIKVINSLVVSCQTVSRTTLYLLYQALKQQEICDELNNG